MAVFLDLNGCAIDATVDDQERLMLDLAAGALPRDVLTAWVKAHVVPV
jgi:death-on-curing protein